MHTKNWKRLIPLVLVLLVMPMLMASSCGVTDTATTSPGSCGFVEGTGGGDNPDTRLHKVLLPGQSTDLGDHEKVSYVPCNSRDYIINNGTLKNANGDVVGDRPQLIVAYTKSGTAVTIAARADWTLNQNKQSMEDFFTVCFKFTCASPKDQGGDINSSTKGWNSMLGETFGDAMDQSALKATFQIDDSIWQLHDPKQYQALADAMAGYFPAEIQKTVGFNEDLFCGSGNSQWPDQNKPGEGEFSCSPVRLQVTDVQVMQNQSDNTEGATTLNEQRLAAARALYGPWAEYFIGIQDTLKMCPTCSFVFDASGNAKPNPNTPSPAPTATP